MEIINSNNIKNIGNFENVIEFNDSVISFDKRRSRDLHRNGLWLLIDNDKYYFKSPTRLKHILNDLLGEKVTQELGLPTVHYQLAKGNFKGTEVYGLLSKYEEEDGCTYTNVEEEIYGMDSTINMKIDVHSLSFLQALKVTYPNQPINDQFKNFLIKEFLTQETDRKMSEISIKKQNGIVELGNFLDYQREWEDPNTICTEYHIPGLLHLNQQSFANLCKCSSSQMVIEKYVNLDIKGLLEEISENNNLSLTNDDSNDYINHRQKMKTYLEKNNLIK